MAIKKSGNASEEREKERERKKKKQNLFGPEF